MLSASSPRVVEQPGFLRSEEPLAEYRNGGYHAVNIGDVLNERYHIQRKLGWGNYSTVWLAHDTKTDLYHSVKILTGIASSTKLTELEYLLHMSTFDPSHPGYSRAIRLFDHFCHVGPYGAHICLVTEVLAESVLALTTYTELRNVHPAVAKGITRDVLQGLSYLHGRGIVHTDLKPDNFLVELEDTNDYVRRALQSSTPQTYPEVQAADGRSITYVMSTPLAIPFEDVQSYKLLRVGLADLGVACWESDTVDYPGGVAQPIALRAPEVHVGAGWDSKCDIWSLGLLLIEMLRGRPTIPVTDQGEGVLESKVFFLLCLFGEFRKDLLERGKYTSRYFNPDGSFICDVPPEASKIPKWYELLDDHGGALHPDEHKNLISFLEAALGLRPEDRWSAAQLLEHAWINTEIRKSLES